MEKEFSVKLPNRPGELARVSQALEKGGVNIRTLSTEASGGIVRLVSSDETKCRHCLKQLGVEFSERNLLVARMEDRPGELARISAALSKEGVNIDGAYMLGRDAKSVEVALAVSDENKARNVLKL
jgi:hypothetical protein